MTLTRSKAVSHGYCVREFDRKRAHEATTEEQHRYDIHFTGVAYDRRYPVVWCGFTSFLGDLLWTFKPKSKEFESKGFTSLREKEEVKIHRGLQVGPDGQLYFGTASLVNVRERHYAPGGRLFRYSPAKGEYEFLGRPIANDYIQTIDVDHQRGIIYGATYPVGHFFGWDLEKKNLLFQAYIADWPHQVVVDDTGQCWATYNPHPGSNRPRLLKYSPKTGELTWTDVGLLDDDAGIDSFVNGGDGFLYIGTSAGALVRLDPRKPRVEFILKPTTSKGFGALTRPVDGKIYGIAGGGSATEVFCYDLNANEVVLYGPAYDAKRKTSVFRPHELVLGPNRCLYCPETDNPARQCYFWETRLRVGG
jgi:hypothetical protein